MDKEKEQAEPVKIVLNEQSMMVLKTVSKDRPHMDGVYLDSDGSMVSTDGHRLSRVTRPENAPIYLDPQPLENGEGVYLPRDVVDQWAKELKEQRKSNNPETQHITYKGKDAGTDKILFSRRDPLGKRDSLVTPKEDKFPPYQEVIPKPQETDQMFSVNIDYLLDMARQAKEFMRGSPTEKHKVHRITFHICQGELEPVRVECRHKETGQVLTHVLMPLRP